MDIRQKIQRLLAAPHYQPLRHAEIAQQLRLSPAERRDCRRVLTEMLDHGLIVRVRHDRFVLPQEADLVVGRITFNERGFAFVIPERSDQALEGRAPASPSGDIYIAEEDTGVALHGDKVVVRLHRERRRAEALAKADKPAGRVIRILERAHATIVGTLQKTRQFHCVIPDEPRLRHDIYTKPAKGAQVGDKVVVQLTDWTNRHINPEGEIIEVLGRADAPGVDILAIIRQHHLPTRFTDQTLAEVEKIPDTISPAGRLDLRDQFIITIDPDDAKDFDDAIHVDELPDGGWRLGIHIADVSHYVTSGSALDREARARGNSVYLVDRVIPMLPEKLSNGLCSLRPREDRFTVSCLIELAPKLAIRKTTFTRSLIHSRHRLTYKEAFTLLKNPHHIVAAVGDRGGSFGEGTNEGPRSPSAATVAAELRKMWRLAEKLRQQRFAQGSLDLGFPESKVRLDKHGRPTHIEKIEYDISHQLIEEFMLIANEAVARHFCHRQVPGLYRIHEDPDLEKLRDFREYAQSFGYKVGDVTHRRELQKLLAAVKGKPEEYAINLALLRSLKQARYSSQPVGHYGLAKKYYTHFTSPIRRYADLVVHRTLLRSVAKVGHASSVSPQSRTGILPVAVSAGQKDRQDARPTFPRDRQDACPTLPDLDKIAEHISRTERVAEEAEKESVELKKLEYFHQQLNTGKPDVFDAVVCGVRNFGFFVELPDNFVQGLVHVSTLDDDFYHYDQKAERLVGKRTRRIIKIGDRLKVQVARVDIFKRQIDFRKVG